MCALNFIWCISYYIVLPPCAYICVYVVCVCGYTCFKTSKVVHVTITFCIGDDQSSVSSSTALARRASAHFSAFSLPRTALWWTPALSGSYGSPILSTWSTTRTRHPWGPTSITCKQMNHNTTYIIGIVWMYVSHIIIVYYTIVHILVRIMQTACISVIHILI